MKGKSKLTPQEELIGKHPKAPDIFGIWLDYEDFPCKKNYKHRKLSETKKSRRIAIEALSDLVITHHKSDDSIRLIRNAILSKNGLIKTARKKKLLPSNYITCKGNLTEIILTEYLRGSSGYSLLVYRLRYNTNIDQSLKGDDVLLFDLRDSKKIRTLLGEAKYRETPTKNVIRDILNSMNKEKLPLSLEFVIEKLSLEGRNDLAQVITNISLDEISLKNNLTFAGLLLSNNDVHDKVKQYSSSDNGRFVFLTLGLQDSEDFVREVFNKAKKRIISKIK